MALRANILDIRAQDMQGGPCDIRLAVIAMHHAEMVRKLTAGQETGCGTYLRLAGMAHKKAEIALRPTGRDLRPIEKTMRMIRMALGLAGKAL